MRPEALKLILDHPLALHLVVAWDLLDDETRALERLEAEAAWAEIAGVNHARAVPTMRMLERAGICTHDGSDAVAVGFARQEVSDRVLRILPAPARGRGGES